MDQYAPPPGPPPGRRDGSSEQYAPPPGPPPGYSGNGPEQYAPPPGPPPGRTGAPNATAPPAYQEWMSVPDTSQLPPPPAINHTYSPATNADESEADQAREWCRQHPLLRPALPSQEQHAAGSSGNAPLQRPREYQGSLTQIQPGIWKGSTNPACHDACLLPTLPLYFAAVDSCNVTGRPANLYFEVKIEALGRHGRTDESSLAIGYCAIPYPTGRMPGWERGSLAVHSDDGHRYVCDNEGGRDFEAPFQNGETIGLGITFSGPHPASASKGSLAGEVFLTRNGRRTGSWNIHEEVDADHNFGIEGLDGTFDLYPCVGLFGAVSFEVILDQRRWLWQRQ